MKHVGNADILAGGDFTPVDADRLMNMKSVTNLVNDVHKTITKQHYEIQSLKARVHNLRDELASLQAQLGNDYPCSSLRQKG